MYSQSYTKGTLFTRRAFCISLSTFLFNFLSPLIPFFPYHHFRGGFFFVFVSFALLKCVFKKKNKIPLGLVLIALRLSVFYVLGYKKVYFLVPTTMFFFKVFYFPLKTVLRLGQVPLFCLSPSFPSPPPKINSGAHPKLRYQVFKENKFWFSSKKK